MKRNTLILFCLCCIACAPAAYAARTSDAHIGPGDTLPLLTSRQELSEADRKYLGIKQGGFLFFGSPEFSVQDIDAEVIVVEFFNCYCTSCQAQAPILNKVYAKIVEDKNLAQRVKFIGIGAGNNMREIARFKQEKEVPFPIIPDQDFSLYEAIGDPGGTPFTLIVKKSAAEAIVASAHMGLEKESDVVFKKIREALYTDISRLKTAPRAVETRKADDRILALDMSAAELRKRIKASMRAAAPANKPIENFEVLTLADGDTVYRCEKNLNGEKMAFYSKVISRKPVCDVCHGIHFIITFTEKGIITGFSPLHLTKYGNVQWHEYDIEYMRNKLLGVSIKKGYIFNPGADAVSMATMTSALIFNSVNRLDSVLKELQSAQ